MSVPKTPDVFAAFPAGIAADSGDMIVSVSTSDSSNWIKSNWSGAPEPQSEMQIGGAPDSFLRFTAPPPNRLRRFIWKWALGVEWKDLRPERKLDELGKLK